jgi:hypothetical protein
MFIFGNKNKEKEYDERAFYVECRERCVTIIIKDRVT